MPDKVAEIIGLHILIAANGNAVRAKLRELLGGEEASDYPGGEAQLVEDVYSYLSHRHATAQSPLAADWIATAMAAVHGEI